MRPEFHDDGADNTHQPGGGKTHQRSGRKGLQHIVEQTLHASGEDALLTLFGVITLHHANAAKRFGEASGDFRVDFRPCAEYRADGQKGSVDPVSENEQDAKRDGGHGHARMNQVDQRDDCSHDPSDKLHQACPDKIADAFHVAHDA